MSLNETCFPIDPQDILPDGTPCIQGFCNKVIFYISKLFMIKLLKNILDFLYDILSVLYLGNMRENGTRCRRTFLGYY